MALVSDLGAMCICQGAGEKEGGVTNSFGNQEENGWRQGDGAGGGGFDEEAKGWGEARRRDRGRKEEQ